MTAIAGVTVTVTVTAAGFGIATQTARSSLIRGRAAVREDHRLTTLESGVRIVTEAMPSVRSVSIGFWVGTGSRHESEQQAGLSHLLEHLLFKGTAKYESVQIDQIFDAMGAELNAGTGKETTSVFARVIDEHLTDAFDVMADMVFRPLLTDVDSEREVILEEIAMYEDDPQEKVFDLLGEATFGSDPLGRAIIGRAEVISGTPVDAITAFHHDRYAPANIVIAAAARRSTTTSSSSSPAPACPPRAAVVTGSRRSARCNCPMARDAASSARRPSSSTYASGRLDSPATMSRRFALRVLDTIFGGTSSSRLFQEVRERRGLAYAVYSFTSGYQDTGQIGLYVGTRADNLVQALEVVGHRARTRALKDPATNERAGAVPRRT